MDTTRPAKGAIRVQVPVQPRQRVHIGEISLLDLYPYRVEFIWQFLGNLPTVAVEQFFPGLVLGLIGQRPYVPLWPHVDEACALQAPFSRTIGPSEVKFHSRV